MVLVGKLGFQRVRSLTSRVQTGWKFEVFSTNVDCIWVRGFTRRSTPGEFETCLCYCFCRVECCGLEFGIYGEFGWVRSLVLVGFEVQPLGFEAVQSSLFLDMTQH